MLQPFSVFILKLIRKKTLKELTWRVQLRTLFPFLCSISGARSMVNPNDLNFNDVICFVTCTKKSEFGIFESKCTKIVPSPFKGVY